VLETLSSPPKRDVNHPVQVVYFVEGYIFGGVERHLLHLLDHLDRDRYEPIVIGVMPDELVEELRTRGQIFVRLDRIRNEIDLPGFTRAFQAVRNAHPVVFHAMLSHSHAAQYALVAAMVMRTPLIVVTAHLPTQSRSRFRRLLGRLIFRGVDVQVLPSEWTKAELIRLGQLHSHYEVVPNGIDLPPLYSPEEARQQLGIASTAKVIGGSMRLVDWKRPELIVEAARELPNTVVVILGEGPEQTRLRSLAANVDLRLPGFRRDAVSLLPAFDVFLHPCPTDNQPLAVLEAMAAAIPVIVADAGGAASIVETDRTGLVAPATAEGMAGAVRQLMAEPELRKRLAAAAQAEVRSTYSGEAMTRRLEQIYEHHL
jgi:glycosyltransferase involved in cell wall biosynthesis